MPADGNQPLGDSFAATDGTPHPPASSVPVEQIITHIRTEAAALGPALEAARLAARTRTEDEMAQAQAQRAQLAQWGPAFNTAWPQLAGGFAAWQKADRAIIEASKLSYGKRERVTARAALEDYKKDLTNVRVLLDKLKKQDGSFQPGRLKPFQVDALCDALKGGRGAKTFKMNMALRFIEWTHIRSRNIEGSPARLAKNARAMIEKIISSPLNRQSVELNERKLAEDDASFAREVDRVRWYSPLPAATLAAAAIDGKTVFPAAMPDSFAELLNDPARSLVQACTGTGDTSHPYYAWYDLFQTRAGQPDYNATLQDRIKARIQELDADIKTKRNAAASLETTTTRAIAACETLARIGTFAADQNGFALPAENTDSNAPPVFLSAPDIAALWNQVEDSARLHGIPGNPAVRALMGITGGHGAAPAPGKAEPAVE